MIGKRNSECCAGIFSRGAIMTLSNTPDVPDVQCGVQLVQPGDPTAAALGAAISSSFAFGGTNAVLVFKRA